ncbi:hypothetical protein B0H11DRAFT_1911879 [Mycena galericulata]|nr:hypothetical protein B0H11DRAFT_1911879 [Mycena galericulata]
MAYHSGGPQNLAELAWWKGKRLTAVANKVVALTAWTVPEAIVKVYFGGGFQAVNFRGEEVLAWPESLMAWNEAADATVPAVLPDSIASETPSNAYLASEYFAINGPMPELEHVDNSDDEAEEFVPDAPFPEARAAEQIASEAFLQHGQPYPGDDRIQEEQRFLVYQTSDMEHVIMDNMIDEIIFSFKLHAVGLAASVKGVMVEKCTVGTAVINSLAFLPSAEVLRLSSRIKCARTLVLHTPSGIVAIRFANWADLMLFKAAFYIEKGNLDKENTRRRSEGLNPKLVSCEKHQVLSIFAWTLEQDFPIPARCASMGPCKIPDRVLSQAVVWPEIPEQMWLAGRVAYGYVCGADDLGKRKRALEAWARELRDKYGVIPVFVHLDKDMAEIGMAKDVWDAKIQLCWWHLRKAVRTRLQQNKLSTTPYNAIRARSEFAFIDLAFKPSGRADPKEHEGGFFEASAQPTSVPTTQLYAGKIRIPASQTPQTPFANVTNTPIPHVNSTAPIEPSVADVDDDPDLEDSTRRSFCPTELRQPIIDLMEQHLNAHPLIPGYAYPSPVGIRWWATSNAANPSVAVALGAAGDADAEGDEGPGFGSDDDEDITDARAATGAGLQTFEPLHWYHASDTLGQD